MNIEKIIEYVMSTPENTNPAVLKSLVKELLTVKKLKDISVRELLSIEDGFYKLETPVAYTMDGKEKELVSINSPLNFIDNKDGSHTVVLPYVPVTVFPVAGTNYHVKLEFSSGFVTEKDLECKEFEKDWTYFEFDDSMFDNLVVASEPSGIFFDSANSAMSGGIRLSTTKEENMAKYGDSVSITVTGKGEPTTGEISGVINISTDTKILDGVTKVITTLADDTSYYVDNIWQDGDALEVSAMDEGSEGGEGFRTAKITLVDATKEWLSGPFLNDGHTTFTNLSATEAFVILGNDGDAYITYNYEGGRGHVGSISGDIERYDQVYDDIYKVYRVFGDCTIYADHSD